MSSGDSGAQGGIVVSGEANVRAVSLVTLRAALKLQVKGLRHSSRGPSALAIANKVMGTSYRTARGAYPALDAWVVKNVPGAVSRPLEDRKGKA